MLSIKKVHVSIRPQPVNLADNHRHNHPNNHPLSPSCILPPNLHNSHLLSLLVNHHNNLPAALRITQAHNHRANHHNSHHRSQPSNPPFNLLASLVNIQGDLPINRRNTLPANHHVNHHVNRQHNHHGNRPCNPVNNQSCVLQVANTNSFSHFKQHLLSNISSGAYLLR